MENQGEKIIEIKCWTVKFFTGQSGKQSRKTKIVMKVISVKSHCHVAPKTQII